MASTTILSDNGVSSGSAGIKTTGGNDGVLILQTTTSGGTATNTIYADTKQNVGINFTPNTGWYNGGNLQLGSYSAVYSNSYLGACELASNAYRTATTTYNYVVSNYASMYRQWDGKHQFYSAASGSANAAISYTAVLQVSKDNTVALQGASFPVAGTGITFPATQSASTDANTLDDYEEGVFSPVVFGGTTSGSATYSVQRGTYVKVGRQVTVIIALSWTGHTGTGYLGVSGVPFTTDDFATACLDFGSLSVPSGAIPIAQQQRASTGIIVLSAPTGGGGTTALAIDAAASIYFSYSFITSN